MNDNVGFMGWTRRACMQVLCKTKRGKINKRETDVKFFFIRNDRFGILQLTFSHPPIVAVSVAMYPMKRVGACSIYLNILNPPLTVGAGRRGRR